MSSATKSAVSNVPSVFDLDAVIQKWWTDLVPGPNWPAKDQFVLDTSGVTVDLSSFTYDTPSPLTTPSVIASGEFDNDSAVQNSELFSDQRSTTASFKWSITEGLKLGAKTTFKVGTPVVEGGVEVSAELSFGSTQEQTTTTTQTWTWSATVNVPAHSKVIASMVVNEETYSPRFTAVLQIGGTVGYRNADGTIAGGASIPAILEGMAGVDTVYAEGPWGKYPASSQVTCHGVFVGVQGRGYQIQTTQSPITDAAPAAVLS